MAQMNGSWQLHTILAIPGLTLLGLTLNRARLHCGASILNTSDQKGNEGLRSSSRIIISFLLLFGAGIVIAYSAQSALLVGIVSSLMYLVPWTKIPVCRFRFFTSSITMFAGAIAWMPLHGNLVHPLFYLAAAWIVLFPPSMMLLLVLVSLPYQFRMSDLVRPKSSL